MNESPRKHAKFSCQMVYKLRFAWEKNDSVLLWLLPPTEAKAIRCLCSSPRTFTLHIKVRYSYRLLFTQTLPHLFSPKEKDMGGVKKLKVDAQYLVEIEKARRELRALISSKQCAPIMLRLAYSFLIPNHPLIHHCFIHRLVNVYSNILHVLDIGHNLHNYC